MKFRLFPFEISFRKLERRKDLRFRTHGTLYVDYEGLSNPNPTDHPAAPYQGKGEARNISREGIRFASYDLIPLGVLLNLTLRFGPEYPYSQQRSFQVGGRVVYCYRRHPMKRYRVGCTFEKLSPETDEILRYYISWLKEAQKMQGPSQD